MQERYSVKLIGFLSLGMMLLTACTQTYSQAPKTTPTLIPTGLFVSPLPSGQDPLRLLADLGTQTAVAKTSQAGGSTSQATGGVPINTTGTLATVPVGAVGTASAATPAPATVEPITKAGTLQATTIQTPISVGRPAKYTLQAGEFPYCIARRFDVNPDDLLSINGLTSGAVIFPGMSLSIPQTGSFPGDRSLLSHPDTYTVDTADTTIPAVACEYGDILPEAIASANNLTISSPLTVGQKLTIP